MSIQGENEIVMGLKRLAFIFLFCRITAAHLAIEKLCTPISACYKTIQACSVWMDALITSAIMETSKTPFVWLWRMRFNSTRASANASDGWTAKIASGVQRSPRFRLNQVFSSSIICGSAELEGLKNTELGPFSRYRAARGGEGQLLGPGSRVQDSKVKPKPEDEGTQELPPFFLAGYSVISCILTQLIKIRSTPYLVFLKIYS